MNKINITDIFSSIKKYWEPEVVANLNGHVLRAIKGQGELGWHQHNDQDKLITVYKGQLILEFRTEEIILNSGEMYIVPKGIEHCPKATCETHFTILEPNSL